MRLFNAGDKVVCVDGKFHPHVAKLYTALPVEGRTYVVREVRLGVRPDRARTGDVSLLLVGLVNPRANSRAALERGFSQERFRHLDEAKGRGEQSELAEAVSRQEVHA